MRITNASSTVFENRAECECFYKIIYHCFAYYTLETHARVQKHQLTIQWHEQASAEMSRSDAIITKNPTTFRVDCVGQCPQMSFLCVFHRLKSSDVVKSQTAPITII